MFFKRLNERLELFTELIRQTHRDMNARNDVLQLLREENKELREQNSKLLDRIMARDFEQLKLYSPIEAELPSFDVENPFADENLIGTTAMVEDKKE